MRKLFSKEELEELLANPYTLNANEKTIHFTVPFKKYFLSESAKSGVRIKDVFRKAGYAPEVLGQYRIDSIARSIRKEALSPRGLRETGKLRTKLEEEDLSKKQLRTAIRGLQDEVIRLQQEVDFLKKILRPPTQGDEMRPPRSG